MKTTYPTDPSKDFNEGIKHLTQYGLDPEDKFEAEFMRIWSDFKESIKNARTKK
jgi:hypothetical protein|tara:strand:+ start:1525 stop:1686 length:162 start_codon:yes stop_codon:yes gene_type:complete